jgi:glutamine amidotransferase
MAALMAVLQTDSNLLRCQLRRLGTHVSLADGDRAPDAYGYGWYTPTEVLLAKRPTGGPAPLVLDRVAASVSGEALLVHARLTASGLREEQDVQPFRFRRWLFAHHGAIESVDDVRATLVAGLPEFLRRSVVAGKTDSALAFAVFLQTLRACGHLDDLDVDAAVAGRALASTVRRLDELSRSAGAQRPSALNLIATNGRLLVATRRGRPLHYALLEGILPCDLHGLGPGSKDTDPQLAAHGRVKAVCIATRLLQQNGFIEVPEGSLVSVGRSLQVTVTALNGQ